MTREEAIAIFRGFKFLPREMEAVDMAIKALEQEPCEDAISRRAAIDLIADYDLSMGEVVKGIHNLPSITPQTKKGHWIRVDKDKLGCSECEVIHFIAQYPQSAKINFCPNCGRKMMQEVEER